MRDPVVHPIGTHELAVEFSFEITTPDGADRRPYVHFLRITDDGKIATADTRAADRQTLSLVVPPKTVVPSANNLFWKFG